MSSWIPWASLLAGTLCLHRSPCSGLLSAGDRQTHSWPATDTLPPGGRVSPEERLGKEHPTPPIPSEEDEWQRLAHTLGGSPRTCAVLSDLDSPWGLRQCLAHSRRCKGTMEYIDEDKGVLSRGTEWETL